MSPVIPADTTLLIHLSFLALTHSFIHLTNIHHSKHYAEIVIYTEGNRSKIWFLNSSAYTIHDRWTAWCGNKYICEIWVKILTMPLSSYGW